MWIGLGLLIGGPPTAWILWGFGQPPSRRQQRQQAKRSRPRLEVHGFFEAIGAATGYLAGVTFWSFVIFGPILWLACVQ